jgi:hypothetical protein
MDFGHAAQTATSSRYLPGDFCLCGFAVATRMGGCIATVQKLRTKGDARGAALSFTPASVLAAPGSASSKPAEKTPKRKVETQEKLLLQTLDVSTFQRFGV